MEKADSSAGRCPPESGKVSLESARPGESNSIGLEVSACLLHSVVNNMKVVTQRTKVKSMHSHSASGRTASGLGACDSAGRGVSDGIGFKESAWL